MSMLEDPLTASPPAEVPLAKAPLVRVIAQVRFPLVVAVEKRDFVAPFQKAIRGTYPVLRQEQTQGVRLSSAGAALIPTETAWRFSDIESRWRVSLTPGFLALETTSYSCRADFFSRLRDVLTALSEHVDPKLVDRLGVRYIDRIEGDDVKDIAKLVRLEVRGIIGSAAALHAAHALSESMFALDSERVVARWGLLPAGASVDPSAIEPINVPSWILDIDMFTTSPIPFAVDRVVEDATRFAERIYTIFRWAVTEDFLRKYGGEA